MESTSRSCSRLEVVHDRILMPPGGALDVVHHKILMPPGGAPEVVHHRILMPPGGALEVVHHSVWMHPPADAGAASRPCEILHGGRRTGRRCPAIGAPEPAGSLRIPLLLPGHRANEDPGRPRRRIQKGLPSKASIVTHPSCAPGANVRVRAATWARTQSRRRPLWRSMRGSEVLAS